MVRLTVMLAQVLSVMLTFSYLHLLLYEAGLRALSCSHLLCCHTFFRLLCHRQGMGCCHTLDNSDGIRPTNRADPLLLIEHGCVKRPQVKVS